MFRLVVSSSSSSMSVPLRRCGHGGGIVVAVSSQWASVFVPTGRLFYSSGGQRDDDDDDDGGRDRLVTLRRVAAEGGERTGVTILTLNDAATLNALSPAIAEAFESRVRQLAEDDSVRAVIITGAGSAFSAGGNFEFIKDRMKTSGPMNAQTMQRFYGRFLCLRRLPVPTIAAINGHAVGAGFAIAAACDFRIASQKSKLGVNFVKLGIAPGMASTYFFPRITSPQYAAQLLLTGDLISASEALSHGMLLSVEEDGDKVLEKAIGLARKIAQASPICVRATVKTLRMQMDVGLEQALLREADTQAISYATEDLEAGLKATKNKTTADFPDFH